MPWKARVSVADFEPTVAGTLSPRAAIGLSGKRLSSSNVYPDEWWDNELWNHLRTAGSYKAVISTIKLPDYPDSRKTREELDEVLTHPGKPDYSARLAEIIEEHEAPPAYYRRMLFADEKRNIQTGALLKRSVIWSLPFIMHFKSHWKRPRPSQLEPRIRPAVDCPLHPAYPSGHSTQAHLVALVMGEATGRKDIKNALWAAAHRIAENREYAGLHYKSDSECGVKLAEQLLPLFVSEHKSTIEKVRAEEWE